MALMPCGHSDQHASYVKRPTGRMERSCKECKRILMRALRARNGAKSRGMDWEKNRNQAYEMTPATYRLLYATPWRKAA